jgi:hypothetical protein
VRRVSDCHERLRRRNCHRLVTNDWRGHAQKKDSTYHPQQRDEGINRPRYVERIRARDGSGVVFGSTDRSQA